MNHTRPGSPQIVLEPDAALTEAVRRELPLPRLHRIRVRPVDGREGVRALRGSSADVVVVDAFVDGRVPAELTTVEFLSDVCRVLTISGVALLNIGDEPELRFVARVAAGALRVFGHVSLVGSHEVLKGKRFGNVVLVASAEDIDLDEVRRRAARLPSPTGVRGEEDVRRLVAGAGPLTAADSLALPPPPPLKGWRIR